MSLARGSASRLIRLVLAAGLILALSAAQASALFFQPAAPALAQSQALAEAGQRDPQSAELGWENRDRGSRAAIVIERRRPVWDAAAEPIAAAELLLDDFATRRELQAGAPGFTALRQRAALEEFAATVRTGEAGTVTGVWVPGTLSLPVMQQPAGDPGFVSPEAGVLTQFSLASSLGTTGLLAHNDLAGVHFFALSPGQQVFIVYGDGGIKEYRVAATRRFKAGQPNSPFSNFQDLDQDQVELSAEALFYQVYQAGDHVVFQTCIEENGISTWGRLFVIATPAGT